MFAIKKMRMRAGLTQQQAADALGLKKGRYGDWERETREVNLRDAIRIADLFKCTLDELAGRSFIAEGRFSDPRQEELNRSFEALDPERQDRLVSTAHDMEAAHHKGDAAIRPEEAV